MTTAELREWGERRLQHASRLIEDGQLERASDIVTMVRETVRETYAKLQQAPPELVRAKPTEEKVLSCQ